MEIKAKGYNVSGLYLSVGMITTGTEARKSPNKPKQVPSWSNYLKACMRQVESGWLSNPTLEDLSTFPTSLQTQKHLLLSFWQASIIEETQN